MSGRSLRDCTFDQICGEVQRRLIDEDPFATQQTAIHSAGMLKDTLVSSLDVHNYRFSRTRYRDLFCIVWKSLPEGLELKGSTIVDIGCGAWNPWGMSFLYLLLGAERCYAFDLDPIIDRAKATKALAELAGMLITNPPGIVWHYPISRQEILSNARGFDLGKLDNADESGLDATRLIYAMASAGDMPVGDGEADLIVSQAFFEHVEDVDEVMAEFARVTRTGGIGIHGIDSTDHRRYEEPKYDALDYLCLEPGKTYFFLGLDDRPTIGHHMNRIRPTQYPQIFERHGFEVVKFTTWLETEVLEARRAMFVEPFRSMPLQDLGVVSGEFVVRKR